MFETKRYTDLTCTGLVPLSPCCARRGPWSCWCAMCAHLGEPCRQKGALCSVLSIRHSLNPCLGLGCVTSTATPRPRLCHNTLTSAAAPRLGLSQHTDISSMGCVTTLTSAVWAVSQHWHQQYGLCHNTDISSMGCVTTLTSAVWAVSQHSDCSMGCVKTLWHQ